MSDHLATTEKQDDGTILIRGANVGKTLSQFSWAVFVPQGVVIPGEKLKTAKANLNAVGYQVTESSGTAAYGPKRMPLPLPECSQCAAPYRRGHVVKRGDCCVDCGQPLTLVQIDPNDDVASLSTQTTPCTACHRPVKRAQRYCTCGQPAPTTETRHIHPMFAMPED